MERLKVSKQPEVLRLHSIDTGYRRQLLQNIMNSLESLTSLKILSNGFANRYFSWTEILSNGIFNYITLMHTQKTLGEEYTYLNMINPDDYEYEGVPVQSRRRLLLFILSTFMPALLRKMIKQAYMEMLTECKSLRNRNWWQEIVSRLPDYDDMADRIHKIVLMLYLLRSDYCSLPQRFLTIRYVYLKHIKQTTLEYRKEGWLMLLQLILQIGVQVFSVFRVLRTRQQQPLKINQQNNVSPTNQNNEDSKTCEICSDGLKDASATPCGHIFCWDCIIKWCQMKPQCPSCRIECQPSRIVQLRNL